MHLRNIGEFFFDKPIKDDIRIAHYYDVLVAANELEEEIRKFKSGWADLKNRINTKLSHLTYSRLNKSPMNVQEKDKLNLETLIWLFEENLPKNYREKWELGKSIAGNPN